MVDLVTRDGERRGRNPAAGWIWIFLLAGSLATLKRFADTSDWEIRALAVALCSLGVLKLLSLFREQTTSLVGVVGVVVGIAMAGLLVWVGIPEKARLPGIMELGLMAVPVALFGVAGFAVLYALAKWRGPREFDSVDQRSRLTIFLNIVLAVTAWQIVRQSTSMSILSGLVQLPGIQFQRVAVEEMVADVMAERPEARGAIVMPVGEVGRGSPAAETTSEAAPAPAPVVRRPAPPSANDPWVAARAAEARGDFSAAAKEWHSAAVASGHDPAVEATAIRALVRAGQPADALRRMESLQAGSTGDAASQIASDPELRLLHAQLLAKAERHTDAADVYESVLLENHGTDEDIRLYIDLMTQRGDSRRALTTIDRLLVKRPHRRLHRWRACLQAAQGDFDNALSTLTRLTLMTPFDPLDAYRLGEIALDAGRPQVALNAVSALLRAGDKTPRTKRLAAHVYAALGLSLQQTGLSGSTSAGFEREPGAGVGSPNPRSNPTRG